MDRGEKRHSSARRQEIARESFRGEMIEAGERRLRPIAIAVIGGILASMVLSVLVTPAVHYYPGEREAAH